ncbi:MAG: M20/M25/M40 family metallo-hydrolase [Clostridia bacterium]|nr:M20/M25/M40 family metallo-hydrolase [Clostridia bacterium]
MKELFSQIDSLAGGYKEFLKEICSIESKSEDKEGVDAVCTAVCEKARALGFGVKRRRIENAGDVASITYENGGKLPPVCISAHMDTVFAKGEFGYPPVKEEDGRLKGPGVIDCKGGIAVGMLVLESLKRAGYSERPVKLILQSDEEVESVNSGMETIRFMLEESAGASAFFNCECREEGKLTTGRKGIIRLYLEVKGRAAHAGDYFEGRSAIREAAYKIIELEQKSVKDGITYNCGVIEGGTALNVVPDICRVYIDVRIRSTAEYDYAMSVLEEVASHVCVEGTVCRVVKISDRKPMERTEANVKLFEHINAVAQKYGFGEMKEFYSNGGSDAAYTTLAGIPTVDDIGPIGDNYHTKDEWCDISSIAGSAKLIAASICEMRKDF